MTPERRKALSEMMKKRHADNRAKKEAAGIVPRRLNPQVDSGSPAQASEVVAQMSDEEAALRANPPRDLLSGQMKGLEIFSKSGDPNDPIPGYRTYWAVDRDQGAHLNLLRASGWANVRIDEILMNDGQGSDDAAGNVRKWSKETGPNGAPIYQYLMKKPLWLQKIHDEDPNSAQSINDRIDRQLKEGPASKRPEDAQYSPGQLKGSKLPAIEITPKLYR